MSIVRINNLGITDGTIVNADINASAGITLAKLSGVNDAKAWVNFNGTGTVAIRASFNVSSITDNGTGLYTINFTNALADANYTIVIGNNAKNGGSETDRRFFNAVTGLSGGTNAQYTITTSSFQVECAFIQNATTREDTNLMMISVFR